MKEFYVDIHCHPTMRAFNTRPIRKQKNIWDATKNDQIDTLVGRWAWKSSEEISKLSQSNLYSCIEGKTRVVFDSLYPIERGFIHHRKVPQLIVGKKNFESLSVTAAGISLENYRAYKQHYNYFSDLQEQYDFLVSNQGASPCGKYHYKIAANYSDLEQTLASDDKTITIVVTIEGAHVFGCGTKESEQKTTEELKRVLKQNIDKVKKWEHPPFFITLAHHFWNQLCGHATSLKNASKIACDQSKGLNEGFTELGLFVLKELLSTKNGKRILIDTRHMSVNARKHYIDYVKKHNKKHPDDLIPIITSHSAVNGFKTMEESLKMKDNPAKKRATNFCAWSLNVSAEEAVAIHESGGIAGVILDKGRHSGINLLKSIDKIKNINKRKKALLKLICDNIFFYIEAIQQKTAWDILTLGSDFDGVIVHFDHYENMASIPQLKKDLIAFLEKTNYKSDLWFGYSPEELMHKLFTQNAMDFLKRNFK